MTAIAYVALGSNLGDRARQLADAVAALAAMEGVIVRRQASVYETAPVGGPAGQGAYLNSVAEVETTLTARQLLDRLLAIETSQGRVRGEKDGPRTLDLDLLLYDNVVLDDAHLVIPHPRLHERLFVLDPLAEIAPGVKHPRLNKSIADLRAALLGVRVVGRSPGRDLAGLRTCVTGSTSGIGKAIAAAFAQAGADVIVHGRRSLDAAVAVAQDLKRYGGRTAVYMADLQSPDQTQALADCVWRAWGGLDVLVNNAGADTLTGDAAKWSFDQKLDALLAVDLRATVRLARTIGKEMKAAGRGVVLTVGWDQAETGMAGDSGELFAAVKGAVMAFSRSLARSLAPEVRVCCLAPGWIRTSWGETASEAWQERVRRETPLGVWGTPEDVARMAVWLASPAATYVTGQVVRVNGGAT